MSLIRRPNFKPPVGSQVNWSHPLAQGIVGLWLCNEGGGNTLRNAANPLYDATLAGTGNWSRSPDGLYLPAGSSNYADVSVSVPLDPNNWTLIIRGWMSLYSYNRLIAWGGDGPTIWYGGYLGIVHGGSVDLGGSGALSPGFHTVAITRSNNLARILIDGRVNAESTGFGAGYANGTFRIGGSTSYGEYTGFNPLQAVYAFKRGLTKEEVAWIHADPYAVLAPRRLYCSGAGSWLSTPDASALIVAGKDPFIYNATCVPGADELHIAGEIPAWKLAGNPPNGALAITGQAPHAAIQPVIILQVGREVLSKRPTQGVIVGQAAREILSKRPGLGVIAGQVAIEVLSSRGTITVPADTVTISGLEPAVLNKQVDGVLGSLAITGYAPDPTGTKARVTQESIAILAQANPSALVTQESISVLSQTDRSAVVTQISLSVLAFRGVKLSVDGDTLTISGLQPTYTNAPANPPIIYDVPAGHLTIYQRTPTTSITAIIPIYAFVGKDQLVLTGKIPTAKMGFPTYAAPGIDTLVITGQIPVADNRPASARITQESVSVLATATPSARVTQESVSVLAQTEPAARVTQISISVLRQSPLRWDAVCSSTVDIEPVIKAYWKCEPQTTVSIIASTPPRKIWNCDPKTTVEIIPTVGKGGFWFCNCQTTLEIIPTVPGGSEACITGDGVPPSSTPPGVTPSPYNYCF